MKSESHWPKGLGEDNILSKLFTFLSLALGGHFVYQSRTVLAILVEGHPSNIPMKFN